MATYRVEGLEVTRQSLRKIADDSGRNALAAIRAGGAVLIDGMRRRAAELSDEMAGTIPRSVHMRSAGPDAVLVGTNHGLVRTVEDGGEITPRRTDVLMSRSGEVFGPRVTMPARPFVRPTMDEDKGKALAAAKSAASKAFIRR